jgi:hypothetical protein
MEAQEPKGPRAQGTTAQGLFLTVIQPTEPNGGSRAQEPRWAGQMAAQ